MSKAEQIYNRHDEIGDLMTKIQTGIKNELDSIGKDLTKYRIGIYDRSIRPFEKLDSRRNHEEIRRKQICIEDQRNIRKKL